mmetsp:Transcript_153503/g.267055  ORF Transcript_153503/g.267055 Transcript_153503/m.267055 type:complete len:245 (-) Transcript_153503:444-1178(-)
MLFLVPAARAQQRAHMMQMLSSSCRSTSTLIHHLEQPHGPTSAIMKIHGPCSHLETASLDAGGGPIKLMGPRAPRIITVRVRHADALAVGAGSPNIVVMVTRPRQMQEFLGDGAPTSRKTDTVERAANAKVGLLAGLPCAAMRRTKTAITSRPKKIRFVSCPSQALITGAIRIRIAYINVGGLVTTSWMAVSSIAVQERGIFNQADARTTTTARSATRTTSARVARSVRTRTGTSASSTCGRCA